MFSKNAIAFLAVYVICVAGTFLWPQLGVWGYLVESCWHPPYHWWGRDLHNALGQPRWSWWIGAAMGFSLLLHWGRFADVPLMKHGQSWFILLFTANAFLVTLYAYKPDKSWDMAIEHLKMLVVYFCIVKTHNNRKLLLIVLGIYLIAVLRGGWDMTFDPQYRRGAPGGPVTAAADNFYACHAVALIPLIVYFALTPTTNKWFRWACILIGPLTLNIVAYAESRGAFLALLAAGVTILLTSRGQMRKIAILGTIFIVLISARLFHAQFWERMDTMKTYEQDASAANRIDAWEDAWKLSMANPFGYGGEAYDEGLGSVGITTHNMFFEILVAWGWQGVILFGGFVFLTFRDSWRLLRSLDASKWPLPTDYVEAAGIFAGLVSMLVTAMFFNRVRWEMWWVFAAVIVCIKNIRAAEMLRPQPAEQTHETLSSHAVTAA